MKLFQAVVGTLSLAGVLFCGHNIALDGWNLENTATLLMVIASPLHTLWSHVSYEDRT